MLTRTGRTSAALLVALTAYVAMNYLMVGQIADRWFEREAYKSAIYVVWFAAGFALFSAVIFAAGRKTLIALACVFVVSLSANYAYTRISGRELSGDVLAWMVSEILSLGNAMREFGKAIALAFAVALAMIALFVVLRAVLRRNHPALAASRTVRFLAVGGFLAFHGIALVARPPITMAETNLFVLGLPMLFTDEPEIRPLEAAPARPPLADKLVLVIDESVSHAIYREVLVRHLEGWRPMDFGEAASTSNCSAASNALLRWGIDLGKVGSRDYDARANPPIWAYARRAGYRTVLIDGQQGIGPAHNFLGRGERLLIDEWIAASAGIDTDVEIAAQLEKRLNTPGLELIYVVKRGSHFPYESNYPQGRAPGDESKEMKYAASVEYSTGRFLERLRKTLPGEGTLLVYTSDHGQDLNAISTHCNPNPASAEYSVPLVAITDAPALRTMLEGGLPKMRNHASHVNLFPTLLVAMGYERAWVEKTYGPTLAGPPGPYLTFVNLGWRDRNISRVDFEKSETFPRRRPE